MGYSDYKRAKSENLGRQVYGFNDHSSVAAGRRTGKFRDYQALQLNKLQYETDQALAAGLISQKEYEESRALIEGGARPNWIQRALFNALPEVTTLGYADTSKTPGRSFIGSATALGGAGGALETFGDVLSVSNYAIAAFTTEATEAALENEYGNLQGVSGAVGGGALGAAIGSGAGGIGAIPGAAIGAAIGGIAGTILNPAFSTQDFIQHYRNRTDFQRFLNRYSEREGGFRNFAMGLAMDIAMDPLTYMTFGVSAGAKVGMTSGIKAGAKEGIKNGGEALARYAGRELTTTRMGMDFYRLAAEKLMPKFRREAAEMVGEHVMDAPVEAARHQEIVEYMVQNFAELSSEMAHRHSKSFRAGFLGTQENVGMVRALANEGSPLAHRIDDLFQETASVWSKERGLYNSRAVQGFLAGQEAASASDVLRLPEGVNSKIPGMNKQFMLPKLGRNRTNGRGVVGRMFDFFDKGWDAPPEMIEHARISERLIEKTVGDADVKYRQVLGNLTPDERSLIPTIIEKRAATRMLTDAGDEIEHGIRYSDHIEEAVKFVQSNMDEILDSERKGGFNTQRVKSYITQVYGHRPTHAEYIERAIFHNGEESIDAANRFAQQRMIASLAEGQDLFGSGSMLTDAYELLYWRKRASIEMMHYDSLMKWTAQKYGTPMALVQDAARGISAGAIKGFFRRNSTGHHQVMSLDQVWASDATNLKRLGFKQGQSEYNADLFKYLMRPLTSDVGGRLSEEGVAHAERLGVNDAAKWFTLGGKAGEVKINTTSVTGFDAPPLPSTFRWQPRAIKELRTGVGAIKPDSVDFSVVDAINMMTDPTHPGWRAVMRSTATGVDPDPERAIAFAMDLHNYTMRHLDAPLLSFIGRSEDASIGVARLNIIKQAYLHEAKRLGIEGKAIVRRLGKVSDKTGFDTFDMKLNSAEGFMGSKFEIRKLEPQVPPLLIELGKATMEAVGYVGHRRPISKEARDEMIILGAQLGFDERTFKDYVKALFGHKSGLLETQHEADIVISVFNTLLRPGAMNRALGLENLDAARAAARNIEQLRYADDEVIKVRINFNTQRDGKYLNEILDIPLGIPTKEAAPISGSDADNVLRTLRDEAYKLDEVRPEAKHWFDGNKTSAEVVGATIPEEVSGTTTRQSRTMSVLAEARQNADQSYRATVAVQRKAANDFQMHLDGGGHRVVKASKALEGIREIVRTFKALRAKEINFDEAIKIWDRVGPVVYGDQWGDISHALKHTPERLILQRAGAVFKREKVRLNKEWAAMDGKAKLAKIHALATKVEDASKSARDSFKKLQRIEKRLTQEQKSRLGEAGGLELNGQKIVDPKTPSEEVRTTRAAISNIVKKFKNEPVLDQVFTAFKEMQEAIRRGDETVIAHTKNRLSTAVRNMNESSTAAQLTEPGTKLVDLLGRLHLERQKMLNVARGGNVELDGFAGMLRPDSNVGIDIALPRGVATFLQDLRAPNIDPKLSGFWRRVIKKYDGFQRFYRTNLLLPHGGYWGRNVMSNMALTLMKTGVSIFNPSDDFKVGRMHLDTIQYALLRWSDIDSTLGYKIKKQEILDKLGSKTVTSTLTGRKVTIKELAEEMHASGVFQGQTNAEVLNEAAFNTVNGLKQVGGALTGAPTGAAAGFVAASIPERAYEAISGDESNLSSYTSLMGLIAGGVLGGRRIVRKGAGKPIGGINGVTGLIQSGFKPIMRLGESASETPFRIAVYLDDFIKTGSHHSARKATWAALNDWNGLSVFERRVMRRMMPFYSWTKFAVSHTFKDTIEEPGKNANMLKVFRDWNENEQADPEDMPDWYHEKLQLLVDSESPFFGILVPKDHKGAISGFGLPIEDTAALVAGLTPSSRSDVDDLGEFSSNVLSRGPFGVTAAMSAVFNRDTFTGGEIWSNTEVTRFARGDAWDTAPVWLKYMVGYHKATPDSKATVNPTMAWVLGSSHASRFINTMKQVKEMNDEQKKELNPYTLARNILGPNLYIQDPKTGQYYENKGRIEALVGLLVGAGALNKYEWWSDINKNDRDYKSGKGRRGNPGSPVRPTGRVRKVERP